MYVLINLYLFEFETLQDFFQRIQYVSLLLYTYIHSIHKYYYTYFLQFKLI